MNSWQNEIHLEGVFRMMYLDNSATTKPYDEVLETYIKVNKELFGNPSSLHNFGGKAEQLISRAREQIAGLIEVNSNEIYFTSGGTEGNNLAVKGAAIMHQSKGNHIITTSVEHPSVKESCEQLRSLGFKITYVPVDEKGSVSVSDIEAALTEQTILVSVIHVNNEVGTIQPIKEIGQLLSNHPKVLFHVDHVQGAGKVPLNFRACHIDLCTVSAHKFHGLKGNGFLFIKEGVHISPLFSGGSQEKNIRSGTENAGGIVAMARALRMTELKRQQQHETLMGIRNNLFKQLHELPDIIIHTPEKNAAPHIITFSAVGHKGEVLVHALEEKGIIVSTTSACSSRDRTASGTLKAMGIEDDVATGAVRISLSYESSHDSGERLIKGLREVLQRLNKVMGRME